MAQRAGRVIAKFIPTEFSGNKFAARYGLDPEKDYWTDRNEAGEHILVLADGITIPDDPPILEASDPDPKVAMKSEMDRIVEKLKTQDLTVAELCTYIRYRDRIFP